MLLEDSAYTIETLRDDYVEWMQKQTTLRNEQSYLEKVFFIVHKKTNNPTKPANDWKKN